MCVYAFIQHLIIMNRQPCGLTGVGVEGSRLKCLLITTKLQRDIHIISV